MIRITFHVVFSGLRCTCKIRPEQPWISLNASRIVLRHCYEDNGSDGLHLWGIAEEQLSFVLVRSFLWYLLNFLYFIDEFIQLPFRKRSCSTFGELFWFSSSKIQWNLFQMKKIITSEIPGPRGQGTCWFNEISLKSLQDDFKFNVNLDEDVNMNTTQ